MKIYTRQGDFGQTRLCNGQVVSKDSERVEAYGTVDELNSFLGHYVTNTKETDIRDVVQKIQSHLFIIGANLSIPADKTQAQLNLERSANTLPVIEESDIKWMEDTIDKYEAELKPLTHFIIPGGCESSALLNISRTVCRRAERRVVELKRKEEVERELTKYLNRLSDLLFVLSRVENKRQGIPDIIWRAGN